jgi:hypothetical protein
MDRVAQFAVTRAFMESVMATSSEASISLSRRSWRARQRSGRSPLEKVDVLKKEDHEVLEEDQDRTSGAQGERADVCRKNDQRAWQSTLANFPPRAERGHRTDGRTLPDADRIFECPDISVVAPRFGGAETRPRTCLFENTQFPKDAALLARTLKWVRSPPVGEAMASKGRCGG